MGERTHEMAFNVTEFVEKRAAQIHDLLAVSWGDYGSSVLLYVQVIDLE